MGKLINLEGQRFGRLTVVELHPERARDKQAKWVCRCECGKETIVKAGNLRSGHSRSCGCLVYDNRYITHNHTGTPEYWAWDNARQRVTNENRDDWPKYGGRGIKMCDRWLESSESFIQDMGPRPSTVYTLERINNDGDYCPENCRWATRREQCCNKINNVMIGDLTMSQYVRKHGLVYWSFRYWFKRKRLPLNEATERAKRG